MADKRYRFFAQSWRSSVGQSEEGGVAFLEKSLDAWARELPPEYVVPSDSVRLRTTETDDGRSTVSLTAVAHHAEARAAVWAAEVQGLLAKQELLRQVSGGVQAAPPGAILR